MGFETSAPCRHRGTPSNDLVNQVVHLLEKVISKDEPYLESKGISVGEFERAFPAAVEKIRGSWAASNRDRRDFAELVIKHLAHTKVIKGYGSSAVKTVGVGDWFEVDATNFPGVYDLLISTSDTNTVGYLKYSVAASGADLYIGVEEIVAALEIDSLKILNGRHKVDKTAKTFTIYDDDGVTPLYVFDLKDSFGSPTGESVYERTPV